MSVVADTVTPWIRTDTSRQTLARLSTRNPSPRRAGQGWLQCTHEATTDESEPELDRRTPHRATRPHGSTALGYRHHRARNEEPLLAIPDAFAWCWQRGGPWKARAKDFVVAVNLA
ncbi:hypothetical protein GCM10017567_09720 [Amycolatopsis bullii]|uniref:Transposase n=1 Tax=Amycolatopsis bullii TaxID=941987 RepID=A0ABQ3K0Z4_9PSEU|nr:hypothetical protein GCM10017567_09720 [Amycolatopsis bullii]